MSLTLADSSVKHFLAWWSVDLHFKQRWAKLGDFPSFLFVICKHVSTLATFNVFSRVATTSIHRKWCSFLISYNLSSDRSGIISRIWYSMGCCCLIPSLATVIITVSVETSLSFWHAVLSTWLFMRSTNFGPVSLMRISNLWNSLTSRWPAFTSSIARRVSHDFSKLLAHVPLYILSLG